MLMVGKKLNRRIVFGAIAVALILVGAPLGYGLYLGFVPLSWGWAGDYYARGGVALEGYDLVAYHTAGEARTGERDITMRWRNLEWRFGSEAHRALFESDPTTFAPQFGGYCALAVSSGYSGGGNPRVWHIEDGKLYFFFSDGARERWLAEFDNGIVARSAANWDSRD